MKPVGMRTALVIVAALMLCTASGISRAQGKGTVAIAPVVFKRDSGTEGAHRTAIRSIEESMQKAGYSVLTYTESQRTWDRLNLPLITENAPASRRDLVRFGEAMNARYVIAPEFAFHTRSIWVDLGPRTDSTATLDLTIVNVPLRQTVYARTQVMGRSDEKFDAVKAGADVLLTPLVTMVSGGPKTPREERAVQIAVIRAMRGFVNPNDRSDE